MADFISMETDVELAIADLTIQAAGIGAIFQDPEFANACNSHMIGAVTRFVRDMGRIGDAPDSRTSRGVTWPGWAMRTVRKYGDDVPDGTRYYYRGHTRSGGAYVFDAAAGTISHQGYRRKAIGKRGSPAMEKVFRRRPGGDSSQSRRYSDGSQMMQASGDLLGFTAFIDISLEVAGNTTTITLAAGRGIRYFEAQHDRRPIWFVYEPDDGPAITNIAEGFIDRYLGLRAA